MKLLSSFCVRNRKNMNGKAKNRHRWKIPKIVLACIVVVSALNFFLLGTYINETVRELPILDELHPDQLRKYLLSTNGCRIPYMNMSYPFVLECNLAEVVPSCNRGVPPLYGANRTSIFLIHSTLPYYHIYNASKISCCYTPFWRVVPADFQPDGGVIFDTRCIPVDESANITEEFIKLTCEFDSLEIYKDYFAFVPLKEYSPRAAVAASQVPLNVLVVGLDGVSRVNLHRQMPNTVGYLQNISAIELLGYHKVADNTVPNVMPILTGLHEDNVLGFCYSDYRRFDACPLIWKIYKRRGFVTAFGEDASQLSIFHHQRKGFKRQPTDYVWGVFYREAEAYIDSQGTPGMNLCIGTRFVYRILLNYIDDFVETMYKARRRYFAFYWGSSLTHGTFNKPRLGDDHYKAFFEKLYNSGRLEDTALFFVSDQGVRCGELKNPYQSHMEEKLPFLFVVLPSWFKRRYSRCYKNLKRNIRRLTTPFDLHETLVHLANFNEPRDWSAVQKNRSYSLFTNISSGRTCASAGIPADLCACQRNLF